MMTTDMKDEEKLEERALYMVIEEVYAETGGKWCPRAASARSIRMGEIIFFAGSDTTVPKNCLRDEVHKLAECPEVAIIQRESDVMQLAHHFFEHGIAHLTRHINRFISMACANAEIAPFVGHNANFLRWSAIQDAAFVDPLDDVRRE